MDKIERLKELLGKLRVLQESLKGIGESETVVGSVAGNENLTEAESCFIPSAKNQLLNGCGSVANVSEHENASQNHVVSSVCDWPEQHQISGFNFGFVVNASEVSQEKNQFFLNGCAPPERPSTSRGSVVNVSEHENASQNHVVSSGCDWHEQHQISGFNFGFVVNASEVSQEKNQFFLNGCAPLERPSTSRGSVVNVSEHENASQNHVVSSGCDWHEQHQISGFNFGSVVDASEVSQEKSQFFLNGCAPPERPSTSRGSVVNVSEHENASQNHVVSSVCDWPEQHQISDFNFGFVVNASEVSQEKDQFFLNGCAPPERPSTSRGSVVNVSEHENASQNHVVSSGCDWPEQHQISGFNFGSMVNASEVSQEKDQFFLNGCAPPERPSNSRGSVVNVSEHENVYCSDDEFDAIIEYDPLSDDEEVPQNENNQQHYMIIANDDGIVNPNMYEELECAINKPIKVTSSRAQSRARLAVAKVDCGVNVSQILSTVPTPQSLSMKTGSCDKYKMKILTSDERPKKNCCPYCQKLQSKFARHIVDMHRDKPDVVELVKFPIGSEERKQKLNALRNLGNFEFNKKAEINKNLLITNRRPNAKFNRCASDFETCFTCFGTFYKKSMRQHKCSRKVIKGDRCAAQLNRMTEGRIHERATNELHEITSVMHDDPIANLAKYDWLLILYGNELSEQYGFQPHHKIVRSRLRMLSRLLLQLRQIEPEITDFASLYHPKYCDAVINAIRASTGFGSSTRQFKTPWSATKSVTEVQRAGRVLAEHFISKSNKDMKEQTNDFVSLFRSRAAIRVNKLAKTTINSMKRHTDETLPNEDDIQHFKRFLDEKRQQYFKTLKKAFTVNDWLNLSEVTMVSLLFFNRRRVGELENAIVEEYITRKKATNDNRQQSYRALPSDAKERVKRYSRMRVRGKRDSTVPILLQEDMEKCVDLLLHYRDAAGVAKENDLLFARPSINTRIKSFIRGSATVKKFSILCGAAGAETLRGTKFRKHFATFCATKEINDNTLTDVANFMGHSPFVHTKNYRGNELNREVARMSQLLEEAVGQNGESGVESGSSSPVPVNKIASKPKRQIRKNSVTQEKVSRKRCTAEEKSLIAKIFKDHLQNGTVPSKNEVETHQAVHNILKNRPYQTIQKWIGKKLI